MMPRTEIIRFSEVMEEKLAAHDDKGGSAEWRKCSSDYLLRRMNDGAFELRDALREDDGSEESMRTIERECADVANFAMMIADRRRFAGPEGCSSCGPGFHPNHDPSPNCESGGHPHCSCDICF